MKSATDQIAGADTAAEQKLYTVTDTLCHELGKDRQHELTDPETNKIKRFKFNPDNPTPMPRWAAMKFAMISGFEVIDANGTKFVAPPESEAQTLTLAPDELVARYDELTAEALFARCATYGEACSLKKSASKNDMIGFLLSQKAVTQEPEPELEAE